jgi:alkylhydroperoxidase/carboxymuconolactone decarboxylase family protein YurZ
MKFIEEYFRQYTEAMDEVESVMDVECPFDEKTRRLIAFALAIMDGNNTAVRAQFNAALKVGAKFKDLAYVASMVEFETTRYRNNWLHEVLGDWIELTKDDYDSGCRCGVVRRY